MEQPQYFQVFQLSAAEVVQVSVAFQALVRQVAQVAVVRIQLLVLSAVLAQQMKDLQEAKARLKMLLVVVAVQVRLVATDYKVRMSAVLVAQVWQWLSQAVRLLTLAEEAVLETQ